MNYTLHDIQSLIQVILPGARTINEDLHAAMDYTGIPVGQLNERLLSSTRQDTVSSAWAYMFEYGIPPITLFGGGMQGLWYDPSDLSTLFQDSAGTIPVTAVGQPVGLMLDKSGQGNHATQSTSAARPTLQQDVAGKYYLSFDGVDDNLILGTVLFQQADDHAVVACSMVTDATQDHVVFTIRSTAATPPIVGHLDYNVGRPRALWRDDASTGVTIIHPVVTTNTTIVHSLRKLGNAKILRVNGAQSGGTDTTVLGATTVNSTRLGCNLYFSSPNLYMVGRLYRIIAIKGALTDTDLSLVEKYVAEGGGLTL